MKSEIFEALELLEKEKGIKPEYMLEKIEAALLSALKRDYGASDNVRVDIDLENKSIRTFLRKEVVSEVADEKTQISLEDAVKVSAALNVGDVAEIPINTKEFGRISAQTAKQVIIQGIREAERGLIYQEFASKEHEILTGVVVKTDDKTGNATLEIGKAQTTLVANEQTQGEKLKEGDTVKVYVVEVKKATKGPQIMISRTHPGLVKRLFELEIPEIRDGVVEIKSIAREAGSRTKIAVSSNDSNVDPIGSCVGNRGIRVMNIVNELKGEKIDIIKFSDTPAEYISAALSPAEVISVAVAAEGKSCTVVVPDGQLSLAIGKEGQNARLAAKLTGWKIDIKPESRAQE
jgi:N utilization substance protein A